MRARTCTKRSNNRTLCLGGSRAYIGNVCASRPQLSSLVTSVGIYWAHSVMCGRRAPRQPASATVHVPCADVLCPGWTSEFDSEAEEQILVLTISKHVPGVREEQAGIAGPSSPHRSRFIQSPTCH
jgi:hypothetical protein